MYNLRSLLINCLTKNAKPNREILFRLALNWTEIVGTKLAAMMKPYECKLVAQELILVVRAERGHEIICSHFVDEVLERVNLFLGKSRVNKIRLIASSKLL